MLDRRTIRSLSLDAGAIHDDTVEDWPLDGVHWSANRQTVFMRSAAPDGIPVILEVDRAGKANAGLRGHAHTSFEAMIHRVVREFGCPSAELKDSTELLRVHAEIEGNISLPAIPQMKRMALAGRIAHSIFHS